MFSGFSAESAVAVTCTVMFVSLGQDDDDWMLKLWLQIPSKHEEGVMEADPHIMLSLLELKYIIL